MKKTLVIGMAIGLISVAATSVFARNYANDPRPAAAKGANAVPTSSDLPAQGYTGAKNYGGNGIVGSSHDMGGVLSAVGSNATGLIVTAGANDPQKRICVFCHHPHNAMKPSDANGQNGGTMQYSPLWNRSMSTVQFNGYNNGLMQNPSDTTATDKRHFLNATDAGGTHIQGVSLLCMSCHDGATAMSAYSVGTGSGPTTTQNNRNAGNAIPVENTSSFEGDMNNHHPMGFEYKKVTGEVAGGSVDDEIADSTTVMVPANGATIESLLYGPNQTMECVTCHDVHNTANQPGAERFLWRSDNQSNFCLTCHQK